MARSRPGLWSPSLAVSSCSESLKLRLSAGYAGRRILAWFCLTACLRLYFTVGTGSLVCLLALMYSLVLLDMSFSQVGWFGKDNSRSCLPNKTDSQFGLPGNFH